MYTVSLREPLCFYIHLKLDYFSHKIKNSHLIYKPKQWRKNFIALKGQDTQYRLKYMKKVLRQSAAMILMRKTKDDFKVLLVKRNPKISFGSSWAFPGGAAERQDFEIANQNRELIDQYHFKFYCNMYTSWYPASLICALRETQEEIGIKFDMKHYITNSQPILRMITPQDMQKRYDTQFIVYNLSSTEVDDILWDNIKIDNNECVDYLWETPKYFIEKFLEGKILLYSPVFLQLFALKELGSINNVFEYIKIVNNQYQCNVTFPFIFQINQIQNQNVQNIIQYPDQIFDRKSVISNENNIILRTELQRRIQQRKQQKKFRFIQQEDDNSFQFESQIDMPYFSFLSCLQNLKFQGLKQKEESS